MWLDGYVIFSIFGNREQWKFAQNYKIFAQVGSQFCQILYSYTRNGQRLFKIWLKFWNFAKSGHTVVINGLAFWLTGFADPVDVAIEFSLELCLTPKLEKLLPVLHPLSLLRKLSAVEKNIRICDYDGRCSLAENAFDTLVNIRKIQRLMNSTGCHKMLVAIPIRSTDCIYYYWRILSKWSASIYATFSCHF